jgi:hypothetical protein
MNSGDDQELCELQALDVLENFLLDIMERLPSDLAMQTRELQQEIETLDVYLARVKRQNQAVAASLARIDNIVGYFRKIAFQLGDTSMLSTVIRPLVHKMRELEAQGKLEVGFTDEEWSDGVNGRKDS